MRKTFDIPYRLFIDDIRMPIDTSNYIKSNLSREYRIHNWQIVRNYDEFVNYISTNGLPTHISFDHDLDPEHNTPEEYWYDYEGSKRYQLSKIYKEKTGADCAQWLCEYVLNNKMKLPICYVHSQNPVGADNIKSILNSYKKIHESENI